MFWDDFGMFWENLGWFGGGYKIQTLPSPVPQTIPAKINPQFDQWTPPILKLPSASKKSPIGSFVMGSEISKIRNQ